MANSYNDLTEEESRVILQKGTERAGTGEYVDSKSDGTYACRRCNAPLYRSEDKFDSRCGWPSFDDELEGAVEHVADADGHRVGWQSVVADPACDEGRERGRPVLRG